MFEVESKPLGSFRVYNATDRARSDVLTRVLPFERGLYRGEPLVDGDGYVMQVRPLGAKWCDGSWRFAVVSFRVTIGPRAYKLVHARLGQPAGPAHFQYGPAIAGPLSFWFQVDDEAVPFGSWETVDHGPLVRAWRSRCRVPGTPVWAQLTIESLHAQSHGKFWLSYGTSDPSVPDLSYVVGTCAVGIRGAYLQPVHAPHKILRRRPEADHVVYDLVAGSRWADGESQHLHGYVQFPVAEPDESTAIANQQLPLLAVALGWKTSNAFGVFGDVPESAFVSPEEAEQRGVDEVAAIPRGYHPWGEPVLGCMKDPGGTGDQADFSAAVMTMAAAGMPHRMHAADWSVRQEACRPTHVRTETGAPLRFSEDPDILLWDCVNDMRFTRNTLGKSRTAVRSGHGWHGHKVSHYSINYLATMAMLTGDRWMLEEIEHHAELWLGGVRTHSSHEALNAMGTARTLGRTLQTGVQLWLLTGRKDIEDRLRGRVRAAAAEWTGRATNPVMPFAVHTDRRNLGGRYPVWRPWQQAIACRGLYAVWRLLGDQAALALFLAGANTLVRYGMWRDENGVMVAGNSVRFLPGGAELQPDQLADGREAFAGFMQWFAPALVAYRGHASADDRTLIDEALSTLDDSWRTREWLAV